MDLSDNRQELSVADPGMCHDIINVLLIDCYHA